MKRLAVILVLLCAPLATAQINCGSPGPTGNDAFNAQLTSGTTLTLNQNCSATNRATAKISGSIFSFTSSATAVISAGTGTAYIYVSNAGTLTVGDNGLTLTCTGCTHASSITAFPAGSIPLWTWTATSGAWDSSGGTDKRGSQFGGWAGTGNCAAHQFETGDNADAAPTCAQPSPGDLTTGADHDLGAHALTFTGPANDGTTGTTAKLAVKINGSGNAVKATISDTKSYSVLGVCVSGDSGTCGTSGSPSIAYAGTVTWTCDGTATIGHWIVLSSATDGQCHDAGTSLPTDGTIILGTVAATHSGSGDATIWVYSPQVLITNTVAAGTYTKVTVNALGQITAGATVQFSDVGGSAACSQLPAMTGDVTTSAGSCSHTIASGAVTSPKTDATVAGSCVQGSSVNPSAGATDTDLLDITIPSGFFNTGNRGLFLTFHVTPVTGTTQTPTYLLKFKFCTVTGCGSGTALTLITSPNSAAMSASTTAHAQGTLTMMVTTTGSSGVIESSVVGTLNLASQTGGTLWDDNNTAGSSTINVTGGTFLQITGQMSTQSGTKNSMQVRLACWKPIG